MRALTVRPGEKDSLALTDLPEPAPDEGPVLVQSLAVGLCGTDAEIVAGDYGTAPPGADLLVLGHENLGRVLEAPPGAGLAEGDLVVGIVRHADPEPCPACAAGEWDMCLNGRYTEHGIAGLHGFARERWRDTAEAMVKLDPALVDVGVLLEPTTVVAKAWEQIDRISARAFSRHRVAAITGAGPIGLLAALLGAQRGLEMHVYDVVTDGVKPELVAALGAQYHHVPLPDSGVLPDIVVECTGVPGVILNAIIHNATDSIVCLTGVSNAGTPLPTDVGLFNRMSVLQNDVVFGTVNANRRHYRAAAQALLAADPAWLGRLITRRTGVADYATAFDRQPGDVKVVVEFAR
jgi:threonine dehydrogenase-like Zn-dependent dehydrogenase